MSDTEIEEEFSLADLADVDITDFEEVRFIDLPAGAFEFEIGDADLVEDEKDGERRFKAEFPLKIVEVKAILDTSLNAEKREAMKESLVGKVHTERFFIDPSKSQEEIAKAFGRIKAFMTDMGLESKGKLGELIRNSKGHTFRGQIVKQKDRHDKTREFARLRLDAKK